MVASDVSHAAATSVSSIPSMNRSANATRSSEGRPSRIAYVARSASFTSGPAAPDSISGSSSLGRNQSHLFRLLLAMDEWATCTAIMVIQPLSALGSLIFGSDTRARTNTSWCRSERSWSKPSTR